VTLHRAIYPGTFDPLTLGHLDVLGRAAKAFDQVVLAVARSSPKRTLFTLEERVDLARAVTAEHGARVRVDVLDGLLVHYARAQGAGFIVRGLRAFADFEYEFQMALINRKLAPDVETLFLMPKEDLSYVSSSRVRELAELGGDVAPFVPEPVRRALAEKMARGG
jgi:pantetheine-phosphate adenylyltransferase